MKGRIALGFTLVSASTMFSACAGSTEPSTPNIADAGFEDDSGSVIVEPIEDAHVPDSTVPFDAGPASWEPDATNPKCMLWLRADSLLTSVAGDAGSMSVSSWVSQCGAWIARPIAGQSGSVTYTAIDARLGSHPSVGFRSSTPLLTNGPSLVVKGKTDEEFTLKPPFTLYVVVDAPTTTTTRGYAFDTDIAATAAPSAAFLLNSGAAYNQTEFVGKNAAGSVTTRALSPTSRMADGRQGYAIVSNGAQTIVFAAGKPTDINQLGVELTGPLVGINGLRIGASKLGDMVLAGSIPEIIFIAGTHSDSERQKYLQYFRMRYQLPLP